MENEEVRVLVMQGHCLLREALIARLEQEDWLSVCAAEVKTDDVRDMIERFRPHVLVMNVSLRCNMGIMSLRKLKRDYYWLGIVAYSCDEEFENTYIGQALRAGADAYLSNKESLDDLIRAIRSVREGRPYLNGWTQLNRYENRIQEDLLLPLSRREAEVFCLTGCGISPQRIAEMMNLSVKTVESYRERIRKKMKLSKGSDLQYAATSFMRSAARSDGDDVGTALAKDLLSTTA